MRSWFNRLFPRPAREDIRVPSPVMQALKAQRDNLFVAMQTADGMLSQGQVKEAQGVIRVALIANASPRPSRQQTFREGAE